MLPFKGEETITYHSWHRSTLLTLKRDSRWKITLKQLKDELPYTASPGLRGQRAFMDGGLLRALWALKTLTKLAKVNSQQASSYPIMVGPSPLDIWNLNTHTGFTSCYIRLFQANGYVLAPADTSEGSRLT